MERHRNEKGQFASRPGAEPRSKRMVSTGLRPSKGLVAELKASWKRHGAQAIEDIRQKRPHDYLRLVASLTKAGDADPAAVEMMSDEELADEIRAIHKKLAAAGFDPLEGS